MRAITGAPLKARAGAVARWSFVGGCSHTFPYTEAATAQRFWEARFRDRGPGHPFWLYTHVPFCPQIRSFCQCSTSLRKSDSQVEAYLEWLDGEIDFLAETSSNGLVKLQYETVDFLSSSG